MVPPKVLFVAVAGVFGTVVDVAIGGTEVGMVAWAAGPSAAERGVAGRGDVSGDGPCRGSVGAVIEEADNGR